MSGSRKETLAPASRHQPGPPSAAATTFLVPTSRQTSTGARLPATVALPHGSGLRDPAPAARRRPSAGPKPTSRRSSAATLHTSPATSQPTAAGRDRGAANPITGSAIAIPGGAVNARIGPARGARR